MHEDRMSCYDLDPGFFASFLDRYLKFTSGLFVTPDTPFQDGMTAMVDHLIARAALPQGARVLDVGSGWGCLGRRLAETRPEVRYVGTGPNEAQNVFLREILGQGALVLDGTFEELALEGPFDAVFLVGAICHLPDKERQLRRLKALLTPTGRIVIEDAFFISRALRETFGHNKYAEEVQRPLFGWAEMPALGDFVDLAASVGFKLGSCDEATASYQQTITHWHRRLAAAQGVPSELKRTFLSHFRVSQLGWNRSVTYHVLTLVPL
jgi:cyclopropane-fatty-acyl-phospholipid synthase